MMKSGSNWRKLALFAGLSVSAVAIAGTSHALIAVGDDGVKAKETEKAEKSEKRRIRVVRSGDGPVTVVGSHGKTVVHTGIHGADYDDGAFEEALEEAQDALSDVVARLKKTKNKDERLALEAAKRGLMTAIETLETRRVRHIAMGPSRIEIAAIEADALRGALKQLEIQQGELSSMRFDLKGELEDAREEIEEALGELELELDLDGDIRALRFEALQSAGKSLDEMERDHLDALKRAEEDIRRERERLEQRLREREAKLKEQEDGKN